MADNQAQKTGAPQSGSQDANKKPENTQTENKNSTDNKNQSDTTAKTAGSGGSR